MGHTALSRQLWSANALIVFSGNYSIGSVDLGRTHLAILKVTKTQNFPFFSPSVWPSGLCPGIVGRAKDTLVCSHMLQDTCSEATKITIDDKKKLNIYNKSGLFLLPTEQTNAFSKGQNSPQDLEESTHGGRIFYFIFTVIGILGVKNIFVVIFIIAG